MRYSTRHWLSALFCFALVSVPSTAQEAGEQKEKKAESKAESVKVAQAEAGDSEREESSGADNYEASEEISEDLSVSYPIDI